MQNQWAAKRDPQLRALRRVSSVDGGVVPGFVMYLSVFFPDVELTFLFSIWTVDAFLVSLYGPLLFPLCEPIRFRFAVVNGEGFQRVTRIVSSFFDTDEMFFCRTSSSATMLATTISISTALSTKKAMSTLLSLIVECKQALKACSLS